MRAASRLLDDAYPGSELYRDLIAAGRIDPLAADHDRFLLSADYGEVYGARSWSEYFSARTVRWIAGGNMLLSYAVQFALRPWRGVPACARLASGRPKTWFERALAGQVRRAVSGSFIPARDVSDRGRRRRAPRSSPGRRVAAGREQAVVAIEVGECGNQDMTSSA